MNTQIGKRLLSLLLVGCLAASLAPGVLAEEDGTADMVEVVETEAPPEAADAEAEETAELTEDAWEEIEIDAEDEVFTALVCYATSGTCGDDLTWVLENGVLTISGTGEMKDYSIPQYVPWNESTSSITTVIIEDGVTTIGCNAFNRCKLTSITIPDSVTYIGDWAFCVCSSLTSVTIGHGVTTIGDWAFYECSSLTSYC
ncbi:MAG: leucine-rich repeat domain-containing protein, partial [Oscillospiraceae bacterium]|nr:leucine-rich repeat domain-containing protein [Oscillospiraceae bacterium]